MSQEALRDRENEFANNIIRRETYAKPLFNLKLSQNGRLRKTWRKRFLMISCQVAGHKESLLGVLPYCYIEGEKFFRLEKRPAGGPEAESYRDSDCPECETHRQLYNSALAQRKCLYETELRTVTYGEQSARLQGHLKYAIFAKCSTKNLSPLKS